MKRNDGSQRKGDWNIHIKIAVHEPRVLECLLLLSSFLLILLLLLYRLCSDAAFS